MNAPATPAPLCARMPAAAPRPGLVAWDLIRKLVAFDTTSRESNLALIDWVARLPARRTASSRTLTFDDDQRKANLFATLPAQRRQRDDRRHRAVGPYRRRAGGRPAVGHESVRGDAASATGSTAAASPT